MPNNDLPQYPEQCHPTVMSILREHGEKLASVQATLVAVKEGVDKLGESINGNGKPGLKADVFSLSTRVDATEANSSNQFNRWTTVAGIVISLGAAVTALVAIFHHA